ncbi:M17 family metallopeptidase [Rufibacter glacialis]|uniref:Leucyl aminopeptidase n=1 Tax=Rufibacter glacialis TaxID=1259555 RepID=A0A5M8QHF9_9BACT|nr:leucyl aminopeptidase [Rufibacter glacialis]KAA6434658.1 leucyl aminopeptidase [Rufibacter glacialis]GGK71410.1 putative cytosol aminopeptidase [Rufibacter glacialis]
MRTELTYAATLPANTSTAVLVPGPEHLPQELFSPQEQEYITRQLGLKSTLVAINRFTHQLYLVMTEPKAKETLTQEALRKAGHALHQRLVADKVERVVLLDGADGEAALCVAEGLVLSNYAFQRYKTEKVTPPLLQSVMISGVGVSTTQVSELAHLLEAVYQTRDLINTPPNLQTATLLSEQIQEMLADTDIKIEVLDQVQIQSLKMGGLLSVNQASDESAAFIILEWKPENAANEQPVVLVGKGVVYDTGGLSLKPTPNSMDYMKSDMSGAAAVAGTLAALARNKVPQYVIGLIPATDNLISAKGFAPGDVITMHSGHTVEVLNTDAEGRLILADALHFAKRYNPALVIDIATLTGAAARAVGREGIVMMGTADDLVKTDLKLAGEMTHERLVEFPLWDEYHEHLKSEIADLKNIGGAEAGAISAGKFLEFFTNYPWVHLDIAGTAYLLSPDSYRGKHATGSSVRLLYHFLSSYATA